LDDWRLLSLAGEGDEDAFRRLVERHEDRLIRLCQRLLLDREEALDAAQEVFIKAYRKAGRLEPRGELFTWLYRVATNHCLNKLRRRRIVRFLPLGDPADDEASGWPEPADRGPIPDQELASRERWATTRAAIGRLPDNQRAVLVLAKFEGLSYREIAQTLGISEGAVESRLFRAMRNLTRAQETDRPGVSQGEVQ
jgi:RNA polymerase sigma-70 factor (ECF subfamily)